jgi:hypothetical protein
MSHCESMESLQQFKLCEVSQVRKRSFDQSVIYQSAKSGPASCELFLGLVAPGYCEQENKTKSGHA